MKPVWGVRGATYCPLLKSILQDGPSPGDSKPIFKTNKGHPAHIRHHVSKKTSMILCWRQGLAYSNFKSLTLHNVGPPLRGVSLEFGPECMRFERMNEEVNW